MLSDKAYRTPFLSRYCLQGAFLAYDGQSVAIYLSYLWKMDHTYHRLLKPGGVLVVLDNAGMPDSGTRDTRELHRIGELFVIEEIKRAGFELDETSDVLRNPDDDTGKSWNSWRPAVPRGFQDRFALRFRKPV